jgi:hypothetical protein
MGASQAPIFRPIHSYYWPKNTLQYEAGPLHLAGAAASATLETAANKATVAIRAEMMRFMVILLNSA